MTRRLVLVEVIEDAEGRVKFSSFGEHFDSRTCATCKWAENQGPLNGSVLVCRKFEQEDAPDKLAPQGSAFLQISEWGDLVVSPTFGCVQWEGK